MVANIDTAVQCAVGPGRKSRRLEFPGCLEVRLTRAEVEQYEGHIEFWDARTGMAMVAEPPPALAHEFPAQRLAKLATLIAAARGSPIDTFGAAGLLQLAGDGEWRRIMQPDQIVYLNPGEHTPPGNQIKLGEDRLPDVVLEVDNTTDVRRGKLYLYESWEFPELWVEVPDKPARSRPKSLRPGLTIHSLERGRFVEALVSRAFPGWTAVEIHRAMNEPALSEETAEVLRRVGRRMGAAEGTGPDDDPFLDAELRESRAKVLHEALQQVFAARGISVSWTSRNNWPMELERAPVERLVQAALECRNEDDFLKRLRAG
ncbi:MAG: hypothetical protein OXQ29_07535 [Rhodospirillaceae bacterium]|nr:hypothetical protein [Rhodospirillaceae bacterium]